MNTAEQQQEKIVESVRALPEDVLQELAGFIEYLRYKASDHGTRPLLKNAVADQEEKAVKLVGYGEKSPEVESKPVAESTSPYEAFKNSGFIGCGEGPSDLAANHKKYLEQGLQEKYGYR